MSSLALRTLLINTGNIPVSLLQNGEDCDQLFVMPVGVLVANAAAGGVRTFLFSIRSRKCRIRGPMNKHALYAFMSLGSWRMLVEILILSVSLFLFFPLHSVDMNN